MSGLIILYISAYLLWEAFAPKIIIYHDKFIIYDLKSRRYYRDPRFRKLIKWEIYFSDIKHFKVNKGIFFHNIEIFLNRNRRHVVSISSYSPFMLTIFLNFMTKKLKKISANMIDDNYNSIKDFLISFKYFIIYLIITFAIPIIIIYFINQNHPFLTLNNFQYLYLFIFFLAGLILSIGLYSKKYCNNDKLNHLISTSKKNNPNDKIRNYFLISFIFYIIALIFLIIDTIIIFN